MSNGNASQETLAIPSEIPWQLLTTTRTLEVNSFPSGSSVSIFSYTPQLESLDTDYPNERVVYFKISVSVASDVLTTTKDSADARFLLEGGAPVWTSVLDLSLSPPPVTTGGGIRPYFIAASPIRRSMLETGVVGDDVYEGEAEGLAYGKSATQMHESFRTSTRTKTTSVGGGIPFLFSASKGTTSTSVSGQRDVVQLEDTTARQASEERRELLSHMTNVSNVLTLLSARDLGSPHLRFTLRPRPLRLLTIDPTDPNLWYAELLHRRSSGIEGIQDFYAIAVVPRSMKNFCFNASLRNVHVLDNPPKPPLWWKMTASGEAQALRYLYDLYPQGTPIDDLDVDITSNFLSQTGGKLIQPVVDGWSIKGKLSPMPGVFSPTAPEAKWIMVIVRGIIRQSLGWETTFTVAPYKTLREVDLETKKAGYLASLSRSPLERGSVFCVPIKLNVCLKQNKGGKISIASDSRSIDRPQMIDVDTAAIQPVGGAGNASTGPFHKAWITWNALDNQLASQLSMRGDWKSAELRVDHPKVMNLLLARMQDLAPDDPANEPIDQAADWLRLQPDQVEALYAAGLYDLRSLAGALNAVEPTMQINGEMQRLAEALAESEEEPLRPDPVEIPLPPEEADFLRSRLATGLQKRFEAILKPAVNETVSVGKSAKTADRKQ